MGIGEKNLADAWRDGHGLYAGAEPQLRDKSYHIQQHRPRLILIITHYIDKDRRLPIAAKPQGICEHLIIDAGHNYCLYKFLDITDLPDVSYKPGPAQTCPRTILIHYKIDAI